MVTQCSCRLRDFWFGFFNVASSWEASRGALLFSTGGGLPAFSAAREFQRPCSLGFGSEGDNNVVSCSWFLFSIHVARACFSSITVKEFTDCDETLFDIEFHRKRR